MFGKWNNACNWNQKQRKQAKMIFVLKSLVFECLAAPINVCAFLKSTFNPTYYLYVEKLFFFLHDWKQIMLW